MQRPPSFPWRRSTQAKMAWLRAWGARYLRLNLAVCPMNPEDAYQRAVALIEPHMKLHGRTATGGSKRQADLLNGIDHLKETLAQAPQNWRAWWVRGKAEQALGDHESAYESFRSARECNTVHVDVARELVAECLELGRTKEAVQVAEWLQTVAPTNAGIVANLALAYLIDAQLELAARTVVVALGFDPSDKISAAIKARIEDVRTGRRPQPTRLGEV
jgi:Tfp pilus assembly protein PilF